MPSAADPHDLRALLAFYAEAGVGDALSDAAPDRFALPAPAQAVAREASDRSVNTPPPDRPRFPAAADRPAAEPAPQETPSGLDVTHVPSRPPPPVAVPDGAQAALARDLARSATSLEALRAIMADFDGCNLKATAKTLVFADGNPQASLMLVGEAPGRDEDIEGLPFVGRSGQLLDRMLAAIGLDRSSAYIANVIPWRPPGNRTPTPHETEICRPFIERQIELANPKLLVSLGGPSAKLLTGSADGILRLRGAWRGHTTAGGVTIPLMPTLHPAYLLRNPAHKKLAWRDFLEIKARLRAAG